MTPGRRPRCGRAQGHISVSREFYDRLRAEAAARACSMSALVERAVAMQPAVGLDHEIRHERVLIYVGEAAYYKISLAAKRRNTSRAAVLKRLIDQGIATSTSTTSTKGIQP